MNKIIISGFGGQGILTIGTLLASIAMKSNQEVTFMPSYGPEMRGGSANCHVIIDDVAIGNPYIEENADVLIALNAPSYEKFYPKLRKNGIFIGNVDLMDETLISSDTQNYLYHFNMLALEQNHLRLVNMIVLGVLLEILNYQDELVNKEAMQEKFKDPQVFETNYQAVSKARKLVSKKVL